MISVSDGAGGLLRLRLAMNGYDDFLTNKSGISGRLPETIAATPRYFPDSISHYL